MTETREQRVERLAARAVEKAARRFTITKFMRAEEGYFHARVTPAGRKPIYVSRRYGSWLAPGTVRGNAVMKELEGLMDAALAHEIKVELQRRALAIEKAEREAQHGTEPAGTGADTPPGDETDG